MRELIFKSFKIKIKNSNEINKKDINDLIRIFNDEYKNFYTEEYFKNKYKLNIYGDSLILLCYDGDKCIASQCFLRNDICGERAFQSADSLVLKHYRGKGIFYKLIEIGVEELGKKEYIYGFPNLNSLKIFKKSGWIISERKRYQLSSKKNYSKIDRVENEYLKFLLSLNPKKLFYIKRGSNYYLGLKKKFNLYLLLGKISKENSKDLKKAFLPIVLSYDIKGKVGNGTVTVQTCKKDIDPPIYKMDTIIEWK